MGRKLLIVLAALFALPTLTACQARTPEAAAANLDEGPERTLVETIVLVPTRFEEIIELNGVTEPIRTADVAAQVPGRIVRFDLEEGEAVSEGDRVLRVNAAQGRAQIDRMEVQLDQLDSEIDRTRRLIDRGLATQSELERLVAQRDALAEGIDEVEVGIRESTTRAPISGIVTETYKEEGEFVGPGEAVARLVDISTIVVDVGLPERDIAYVNEGQPVTVRIEATGEQVVGTLDRIGIEANPLNRTFPLEIHVDNPDGRILAGMRATALLPRETFDQAIIVPRDAVVQSLTGSEVFVNAEGTAQAREVRLGPSEGRFVVVIEGLEAGEEIVSRGHRSLVNGEAIEATRSMECCAEQYQSGQSPAPVGPTAETRAASSTPVRTD